MIIYMCNYIIHYVMKDMSLRYLDKKIYSFVADASSSFAGGWIRSVRHSISMPCKIFADRLGANLSYIHQLEEIEISGKIGLDTLRKAADALDCHLVYAFVPKSGSFKKMLSSMAEKVARKEMKKLQHTMRLEAQGLDQDEFEEQVQVLKGELLRTPKKLWKYIE